MRCCAVVVLPVPGVPVIMMLGRLRGMLRSCGVGDVGG